MTVPKESTPLDLNRSLRDRPATILVVEDDPDNAELISQILEIAGYRVERAPTGPQALEIAASDGIDLILLDVMLPGIDGFEVCRRLRQDPTTVKTPIVLVSAKSRREDIDTGVRAGATGYMSKPLSRVDLLTTVRNLLEAA